MSYFVYSALESTSDITLETIILLVCDLLKTIISREPLLSILLGNAGQSTGPVFSIFGLLCFLKCFLRAPLPPPPFLGNVFLLTCFLGSRDCVRCLCGMFTDVQLGSLLF